MIALARRLNVQTAARYVLNQSSRLEQFETASFDFVYSDIVLQHLEPSAAEGYVAEFLRVLKPGAIAVFQLPSHQRTPAERPQSPVRMPAEAYQTRLTLAGGLPSELAPSETAMVTVEVQNTGPIAWKQPVVGAIRVGNHWRDTGGSMLIQDDGRTRLPEVLESGASFLLPLTIQAPPEQGTFLCEFDVVHEGISWFGDVEASPTLRIPVTVSLRDGAPSRDSGVAESQTRAVTIPQFPDIYSALEADDTSDIPPFPMHGVPRARVVDLVNSHGGNIFFVEEDERGGPEWSGYRYFVEKKS
jgi:SAM-dependent methyltransferase